MLSRESVKSRRLVPPQYARRSRGCKSIHLDTGRSVPATTAIGCGGSRAAAVNNPEADDRRSKEEDRSQEAERDISLELGAFGFASDAVPVPD